MSAHGAVRLVLVVALAIGVLVVGVTWWTRPRLLDAGHAVVVVEGREIGLDTENVAGSGIEGRLGLVGGRCVGLVGGDGPAQVVVWPGSTVVRGEGDSLTISSNGETFRLGDRIDAGSAGRRFPELGDRLPDECANASLTDVIPGD